MCRRAWWLGSLFFALCLLWLFPQSVEAHAILLQSDPARDAVLSTPPSQVRMWFSENLNPTFSTAYVVKAANSTTSSVQDPKTHVDTGNAHISPNNTKEMDVSLKPHLSPEVYIVFYRTQSADDGHILHGSFLFTVAAPNGNVPTFKGTVPGQETLVEGNPSGQLDAPTLLSLIMITLVELCAIFWVGAQLWVTFVLQTHENQEQQSIYQDVQRRFERIFSIPTLLVLFFANIGVLIAQAFSLAGGQWTQAFAPATLTGLIAQGHFGTYWMMREIVTILALTLALVVLLRKERSHLVNELACWTNLLLGLALLIAITMSGHAAATSNAILVYAVLVDWLHLLAASLWVGGMLYLVTAYLPILQPLSLRERTGSLLATLPHYSPLAIIGVIIMAVTGPFNAVVHLTSWGQLITTAYGRALVTKVLLVGGLLLTSALHVGLLRPRLAKAYATYLVADEAFQHQTEAATKPIPGFAAEQVKRLERRVAQQTDRMSTILRWEPLLGVAVLVCTGLMTVFAGTLSPTTTPQSTPQTQQQGLVTPQPTASAKPYVVTVKTTDQQFLVKVHVNPNRFGSNVFTVTVLNSKGVLTTNVGVSLYTTMLDMDMGTESLNLQPDGKGNFSASGDLSMPGNWQLRVEIRTPDNALHEARVKFVTPY